MLIALTLSGCAGTPDFSRESLLVVIVADGPVEVGVPLWLAPDGASAEQWMDNFQVHAGAANISLRQTDAGLSLWIETSGYATVEAQDLRSVSTGAVPRAFLDGWYSLGVAGQEAPLVADARGVMDIHWSYEATSDGCSLFINQSWIGPNGTSPAVAKPFAGRSPPPHCTT